jgi:hypothetical protein
MDLLLVVLVLLYANGLKIMCMRPSWELARRGTFLLLCIPLRLMIARHSAKVPAGVFGAIAAGFMWNSVFGGETGFFGGKVWWSRSAHAGLFLLAAYERTQDRDPRCILYADVLMGLVLRLLL